MSKNSQGSQFINGLGAFDKVLSVFLKSVSILILLACILLSFYLNEIGRFDLFLSSLSNSSGLVAFVVGVGFLSFVLIALIFLPTLMVVGAVNSFEKKRPIGLFPPVSVVVKEMPVILFFVGISCFLAMLIALQKKVDVCFVCYANYSSCIIFLCDEWR